MSPQPGLQVGYNLRDDFLSIADSSQWRVACALAPPSWSPRYESLRAGPPIVLHIGNRISFLALSSNIFFFSMPLMSMRSTASIKGARVAPSTGEAVGASPSMLTSLAK
jgi:hypothetical protein